MSNAVEWQHVTNRPAGLSRTFNLCADVEGERVFWNGRNKFAVVTPTLTTQAEMKPGTSPADAALLMARKFGTPKKVNAGAPAESEST